MTTKKTIWYGITIGSIIGGYIPTFWGAELLSSAGILGSGIGSFIGIFLAYKISK